MVLENKRVFHLIQMTIPMMFNSINFRSIIELSKKRKWKFEINIEPGIYINEHQLLNQFYVQPRHGDDYLDKRIEYTTKKQINEYVLNLGNNCQIPNF